MLNCNKKKKKENAIGKRQWKKENVTGISSKYKLPGSELLDETGTSTNSEEYRLWKSHENQQGQGLPVLPRT